MDKVAGKFVIILNAHKMLSVDKFSMLEQAATISTAEAKVAYEGYYPLRSIQNITFLMAARKRIANAKVCLGLRILMTIILTNRFGL
jgi:hypothetical protein